MRIAVHANEFVCKTGSMFLQERFAMIIAPVEVFLQEHSPHRQRLVAYRKERESPARYYEMFLKEHRDAVLACGRREMFPPRNISCDPQTTVVSRDRHRP